MKGEISKTLIVDAKPPEVFRALTDEAELPNWFPNAGAKLEPRVGGRVVLKTRRPGSNDVHIIEGRILEFVQDRKLSHTWSSEESIVTWTLEQVDDTRTKTRVTLVHRGVPDATFADTDRGWSFFAGRLADYCRQKYA